MHGSLVGLLPTMSRRGSPTAVPDTELMQDAEDVGVAVAVAVAEDEDCGASMPKRRRLRKKQKAWGPWLTRPMRGLALLRCAKARAKAEDKADGQRPL